MATKKAAETATQTFVIENIVPKTIIASLEGTSDLILCAKARSYVREEIFKQSHPKGTKIPAKYQQPYNLYEKLITSIHWLHPIEFHDDDYSKYTEEEWSRYMKENQPCILSNSFAGSMKEAFTSFYKDSTGKNNTDLKRSVNIKPITPITFDMAGYDQHLAQTSGLSRVNVLTQQNVFSGWRCDLELTYVETVFPKETIIAILNTAGSNIGVGSRRGEGYGRFTVKSVTEIG